MKRLACAFLAAAALCCAPQAPAAARLPARDAEFERARADAAAADAFRSADFREAAAIYAKVAARGGDSAATLHNLGACRLLAGDVYGAVAAFDAAERRAGETPDTLQDQIAANARMEDDPGAGLPALRRALRPHWAVPMRTRALAAGIAWATAWAALAAALVLKRAVKKSKWPARAAAGAAAIAFAASMAAGASAAVSAAAERRFAASLAEAAPEGGAQ